MVEQKYMGSQAMQPGIIHLKLVMFDRVKAMVKILLFLSFYHERMFRETVNDSTFVTT